MGVAATYRDLLRNGPLTRLLVGEFISSIGDWLYLVALVVLVYRETADPVVLGIVGAVRMLPYILLSIPAGVITDRIDRRLVLLVTDLARAACMLVMAWLVAAGGPLWAIAGVAMLAACFSTFFYPAIGALIPSLVRDEREFGPANSAWATLDNLAWVIGPGIAGLLLATGDIVLAFVLNALTFAVIAVVLWTLPRGTAPREAAPAPSDGGTPVEAATLDASVTPEATRTVLGRRIPVGIDLRAVGGVIILDALAWFAFGGVTILIVVIAVDVFHGGEAATGYLNGAIGVGGTIGAILSGALVLRPRLGPVLLLGAGAFGAALAVLGVSDTMLVAFLAIAVVSIGNLVLDVTRTTVFQRVVPDAYRGRFTGMLMTTQSASESAGTLIVPILVALVGFGWVLGVLGVLLFAGTVLAVGLIGTAGDVALGPFDADLRRIARLPPFGGLSPARVEGALHRLQPIPVAAGEVVIRQGEPADRFYVVRDGTFEVTQLPAGGGEPVRLRILEANAVFGERGLIARAPRSATVTAKAPGMLFAMDGDDFLALVGARPAVRDRLMALYDTPAVEVAMRS